jgi:hypothetical protein
MHRFSRFDVLQGAVRGTLIYCNSSSQLPRIVPQGACER